MLECNKGCVALDMRSGPSADPPAGGDDTSGEHKIIVQSERFDRHAVWIFVLPSRTHADGATIEAGDAIWERAAIIGVAEDRPSERSHEAHLVGRTDISAWPTEWREIDDHGFAVSYDAFHSAADSETSLVRRYLLIADILFITWKHANEPMLLADRTLTHADFTRVGEKDFGSGQVDTHDQAILRITAAIPLVVSTPRRRNVDPNRAQKLARLDRRANAPLRNADPLWHGVAGHGWSRTHAAADNHLIRSGRSLHLQPTCRASLGRV